MKHESVAMSKVVNIMIDRKICQLRGVVRTVQVNHVNW